MKTLKDQLGLAQKVISDLQNMPAEELFAFVDEVRNIKKSILSICKAAKTLELRGKKAKVKEDTSWIYAGETLTIIEVYMVDSGEHGVYPVGSLHLRLSLVGTKFEYSQSGRGKIYHNTSTVINTKDLILLD